MQLESRRSLLYSERLFGVDSVFKEKRHQQVVVLECHDDVGCETRAHVTFSPATSHLASHNLFQVRHCSDGGRP